MSGIPSFAGSHAQLMQEVGMKVAAKAMDVARQQGAATQKLLDAAVEVQQKSHAGGVEAASGRLDVTA